MNEPLNTNLSRNEILNHMAVAAADNFEMSCSWARAAEAARQEARDLNQTPEKSFVLHSIDQAKIIWGERMIEVKNALLED